MNDNFIKETYNFNIYNILNYEYDKTYYIINNIKFKSNYFKINKISFKNMKLIFNYLKDNYLIDIITIYSYNNNINSFKNVNRYNYKNLIENYFKLIFKYDLLNLLNLFYFHLINNEIKLNI